MPEAKPYTHINLEDARDMAPGFGFGDMGEVRFVNKDLDAERTGLSHHRLAPGARQPFGHKHDEAEEVYVVLSGSGRVKLGDEIREIKRLDAIRVAPEVIRNFEASDEGLELLACGARHEGDGEILHGWWSE
jgi:mannose-6-phosphate isomerase-like protein (cupin superfamily)